MSLRVLIADDESLARTRARRLVESLGHRVVAECTTGREVLDAVGSTVDVVLLDIDMPELDGIDAASALEVPVIFVSAHDRALEAFELGALHYLSKPLSLPRLAEALARVSPPPVGAGQAMAAGRLVLQSGKGTHYIERDSITHASFDGALVTVFVDDGRTFTCDRSLTELEAELGDGFLRVHRRALVNGAKVHSVEHLPSGASVAHLEGGKSAPISRKFARDLRRS
ncbi:MAG: LytTR family DNA-binding domain-containing protein [Myxococcota bacterium]